MHPLPLPREAPHIDSVDTHGPYIAALSLHAHTVMDFSKEDGRQQQVATCSLLVPPRSLLLLQREARYQWLHGIRYRKSDVSDGRLLVRGERISLTFRFKE